MILSSAGAVLNLIVSLSTTVNAVVVVPFIVTSTLGLVVAFKMSSPKSNVVDVPFPVNRSLANQFNCPIVVAPSFTTPVALTVNCLTAR